MSNRCRFWADRAADEFNDFPGLIIQRELTISFISPKYDFVTIKLNLPLTLKSLPTHVGCVWKGTNPSGLLDISYLDTRICCPRDPSTSTRFREAALLIGPAFTHYIPYHTRGTSRRIPRSTPTESVGRSELSIHLHYNHFLEFGTLFFEFE